MRTSPQELPEWISTGRLPSEAVVQELVAEAHRRFSRVEEGELAGYIPALAAANPAHFGLAVASTEAQLFEVGDAQVPFSIQSISKPFLYAWVCEAIGEREAREKLGVNSTGLPFNSVQAVERADDGLSNPMVNAGAIAATSLAPGDTLEAKWTFIQQGFSRFAGRSLQLDEAVYASELASNRRNLGIANLLDENYISTVGSGGFGNSDLAGTAMTLLPGAPRQMFLSIKAAF